MYICIYIHITMCISCPRRTPYKERIEAVESSISGNPATASLYHKHAPDCYRKEFESQPARCANAGSRLLLSTIKGASHTSRATETCLCLWTKLLRKLV